MIKVNGYEGEERRKNGESKWQLAFWLITIICGVWLSTVTSNVVANDRIRASEDLRIQSVLETKIDKINERQILVLQDIREIETLLGEQNGRR